ncbi:hypothetical protein [Paenibacillus terrigena]|uniref:hypothetical protein n=1 Tax=Paenibacillus terrigena TaxID=369333 RepID=UPI00036976F7|nr:hypothetical protein [Paenibacillus terrigena]
MEYVQVIAVKVDASNGSIMYRESPLSEGNGPDLNGSLECLQIIDELRDTRGGVKCPFKPIDEV